MTYEREVRLGLVLYGGVSLAVYENGVAQELYRAARGQGVYALIAKLIDSDVVIDIISGTSAGGVNGIMLAYALANQREFAPSADLWRNEGDIQALLRAPDDINGSSVLNSDYYQNRLASCFDVSLKPDPTAPPIEELDLFVTSTDTYGRISTVYDDDGHAIDIKSHRALFKLAHRNTRKNDLKASAADLAKLSRMTSCFPVAFEPVCVTSADQQFFDWGKLREPAVYLDGGILNNKPFTSTIEAIASRTATRAVERFLIYVDPDPEQCNPSAAIPSPPTMVKAAVNSLISIPGYQSIGGDLQAIQQHNERATRVSQIVESLPDAPDSDPACIQNAAIVGTDYKDRDRTAYYAARLIQLRDTVVGCILNDSNGRGYFPSQESKSSSNKQSTEDTRRSGRILVESFNAWPGDGADTLRDFDVFFRMRRAKHLANTLMRAAKSDTPVAASAWELVNHYYKLYEMMKWALTSWINQWEVDWKTLSALHPTLDTEPKKAQEENLQSIAMDFWASVKDRLEQLLNSRIVVPVSPDRSKREDFYKELKARLYSKLLPPANGANLLDTIDDAFKASLLALAVNGDPSTTKVAASLQNEFCRFLEVDRQLFLLQVGSGFESSDLIRVVRFSPLDAQRCLSQGLVQNKVRGSALASFGGFFKKSWRANDIMMGRFDAACLLIECLLTKERLTALGPRRRAAPITVTCVDLLAAFPHIGDKLVSLQAVINNYLAAPEAATDQVWNDLIDHLVCACHDEIQREEWPRVIASSIEQEYGWGRYRKDTNVPPELNLSAIPYDRKHLVWTRAKSRPEEVLVQVASAAIASGTIPPFAPGQETSQDFLREIPESILEELGALALIRLGKGLLTSIMNQKTRDRVASNKLFRFLFDWAAPILYRLALMRRTQPGSVVILNTAILVACFTSIILALCLFFLKAKLGPGTWAILIALPLVSLFVWGKLFRK